MRTNYCPNLRGVSSEDMKSGAEPIRTLNAHVETGRSHYRYPFLAPRHGKITIHGFDQFGQPTKDVIVIPAPRPD